MIVALKRLLPETFGGAKNNCWNELYKRTLEKRLTDYRERSFTELVSRLRPSRILEIGVGRGWGAERMARAAGVSDGHDIEYYGFDLYDGRKGRDNNIDSIRRKLEKLGVRKIRLFAGDTTKTLPVAIKDLPPMDFIYIDGGHLYDVVKSDWENAQRLMHSHTVVVFDDYDFAAGVKRVVDAIEGYQVYFIRAVHVKAVVSRSRRNFRAGRMTKKREADGTFFKRVSRLYPLGALPPNDASPPTYAPPSEASGKGGE